VWRKRPVETQLHHERLRIGQLLLLTPVERLRDEKILTQNPLDNLQVLVWIICLAVGLLPCHLTWSIKMAIGTRRPLSIMAIVHLTAVVEPLLLLLGTLFEEHLSQHILLFLMRIVVFYIIIMWLVKYTIRIMIAVWIFVSNSSSLRYTRIWVDAHTRGANSIT
jgi:hypothetical protein